MAARMRKRGKRGKFYAAFRSREFIDPKTGKGKLVEVCLGTTDEVLAERELGMLDARIADGGGDPTLLVRKFSEIADQFKSQIVPTFAATTQVSCLSRIKADLVPFFGRMKVCDINDSTVIAYKVYRESKGANGQSITVELSNFKSIMTLARPDWRLPNSRDQRMRFVITTQPIVRYFHSEQEFQNILGFCPDWLKPIVIVARKTGLRRANVMGMKWAWVNMFNRTINIPGNRTKNKKYHTIRMNETVYSLFKSMEIKGEDVFPPTPQHENRKYVTWVNGVYYAFKRACKLGGRPEFRFHDLRHDFCSQLVQRGVPLMVVRDLAGHSSIKITERYAHLAPENLSFATNVLDELDEVGTGLAQRKGSVDY